MSHALDREPDEFQFKWGKKRGIGKRNKDVQFYESFTYDGVDYTLHDCVYMYKEGEPEPYIGKLVKIWESASKSRKIVVQWFFRPSEIAYYLKDTDVLKNELFLASGKGTGLSNVNPLEAIAGNCNVICISTDKRNPQPSAEELLRADYVFYRTFDVQSCIISDQMDDTVGGLDVKFVFNRAEGVRTLGASTHNLSMNGEVRSDILRKDGETPGISIEERIRLDTENVGHKVGGEKDRVDDTNIPVSQVQVEERAKSASKSGHVGDIPSGRARSDGSVPPLHVKYKTSLQSGAGSRQKPESAPAKGSVTTEKDKIQGWNLGASSDRLRTTNVVSPDETPKSRSNRDFEGSRQVGGFARSSSFKTCVAQPKEKKLKLEHEAFPVSKDSTTVRNSSPMEMLGDGVLMEKPCGSETKNSPLVTPLDSKAGKKVLKEHHNVKVDKFSNNEGAITAFEGDNGKLGGQIFEVTQRPTIEKINWMKLPWEEKMKAANHQRKLVLLQNLDPEYTSGEVEDIIWHAFNENCTARVVQHTAISNPHSGQAFVVFKSRETVDRVMKKLNDRCLMLPNQRPLVASAGFFPKLFEKQTFVGHLAIDKARHQISREAKEAVSTSHYSQHNTIEHEMAMAWCLLQSQSDEWWNKLYEQQREELGRLIDKLKPM